MVTVAPTRGRKGAPQQIAKLRGNPSRRDLSQPEVRGVNPPNKPDFVADDERASAEWDRVVAAMPPGIFSDTDEAVLATYAIAYSIMIDSLRDIKEMGYTVPGARGGFCANPAISAWVNATAKVLQATDRLGLSPVTRSKLKVPEPAKESKLLALIGTASFGDGSPN